mgnify:FL=1
MAFGGGIKTEKVSSRVGISANFCAFWDPSGENKSKSSHILRISFSFCRWLYVFSINNSTKYNAIYIRGFYLCEGIISRNLYKITVESPRVCQLQLLFCLYFRSIYLRLPLLCGLCEIFLRAIFLFLLLLLVRLLLSHPFCY